MNYKSWLPLAGFAVLVLLFAFGIQRSPDKDVLQSVLIGKPAPEFALPNLMEPTQIVSSKTLLGKPYLLNVWATWCVQCRVEHATLLEIQKRGEVQVIGLNWQDKDDPAREWIAQLGNPYAQIAVDREGRTAIDFGVYGAPESFLIDANGVIVHKYIGPLTIEAWQREFLPRLNGRRAGAT